MLKLIAFFFVCHSVHSVHSQGNFDVKEGDQCTSDLTNAIAVCVDASKCELFKANRKDLNICSFEGRIPIVCCPNSGVRISETVERKSATACKFFQTLSKIESVPPPQFIGGRKTFINQFPHMTAIGSKVDNKILWRCGGSLISSDFVLTAAHCRAGLLESQVVRIGDKNLQQDDDGTEPQEFGIKRIIVHPEYKRKLKYHDIMLMQLSREAVFNIHVLPACLYQSSIINETSVQAMGYGSTSYGGEVSDELLEGYLDIVGEEECNKSFSDEDDVLPNGILASQICAGDKSRQRDTCQGDSGGPLQISQKNQRFKYYEILGITSFGRFCATGTPGVYTRVSSYIDWIESIVWP